MNTTIRFIKLQSLSLAVVIGLAGALLSLDLLGTTTTVLAQESPEQSLIELPNLEPRMLPLPQLVHVIVFTDPANHAVLDLAGNHIGEGVHIGEVRCRGDNCNHKTQLGLLVGSEQIGYEYQFKTLQMLDPEGRRSVVTGMGTIYRFSGSQKERFSFTATFEDNGDGTVSVTYIASRPDASFIIPSSPGTFGITSKP